MKTEFIGFKWSLSWHRSFGNYNWSSIWGLFCL